MMMQPFLILFVLFLVLSILLLILLVKQKSGLAFISAQGQLDTIKVSQLETEVKELEGDKYSLQAELKQTEIQLVQAQTRLEGLVKQDDFLQQSEKSFENLAQKILDAQSKKLKEESSTTLSPLQKDLKEFKERMESINSENMKGQGALKEQLQSLKEQSMKISDDANNLTKALKGDSQKQGAWGEMILEKVLEASGLRKDQEYLIQGSFTHEDGTRSRPDVIVKLPENKDVIIDSKVSLVAWEQYCNLPETSTEEEKQAILKMHLASVKNHIKDLSGKSYEEIVGINSLDFVLLFVPIEAALLVALQEDSSLFQAAFEKNIILVTPSTLLVTLRTIQNIWRYEHQSQNAKAIALQGTKILDKFAGFVETFEKVGKSIQVSQDSYEKAFSQLKTGRGSLLTTTQKLEELGVKATKQLPLSMKQEQGGE